MTQTVFLFLTHLWPFFHTKAASLAPLPLLASLKCSCSAGEGDLSVWLGLLLRTFASSVPIYFASFVFSLLTVELANGHSQMLAGGCMKRTISQLDAREASWQVTNQDQEDCKLSDFQSIGAFQCSWLGMYQVRSPTNGAFFVFIQQVSLSMHLRWWSCGRNFWISMFLFNTHVCCHFITQGLKKKS